MWSRTYLLLFLILFVFTAECKRSGGGRSRSKSSSSSSSSSIWNRKKDNHKAEAPKQEAAKPAVSATQTPIGWNVNGQSKGGIKSGPETPHTQQKATGVQQASAPYPQQNYGGISGQSNGYNPHQSGGYNPHQPGGYNPHQPGGYNPHQPGGYNPHQPGGYNPHQPGGYNPHQPGGYNPHQPGGYNPSYNPGYNQHQPGGYNPYQPGGYNPMYGSQQRTGMLGGMMGGGGGFGYNNGYGMQKSGGFFSGNGFRNVLLGMGIWYMVSGLTKSTYRIYSDQNRPEHYQKEIQLPANVLTLCNENATSLCTPGTHAICTQNSTIMCAASINSATPCQGNANQYCISSTVPCLNPQDPLCQNRTDTSKNETQVSVPCFTTMTLNGSNNATVPGNADGKYCITTMAVPDPTVPDVPDVPAVPAEDPATFYYGQYAQGHNYLVETSSTTTVLPTDETSNTSEGSISSTSSTTVTGD